MVPLYLLSREFWKVPKKQGNSLPVLCLISSVSLPKFTPDAWGAGPAVPHSCVTLGPLPRPTAVPCCHTQIPSAPPPPWPYIVTSVEKVLVEGCVRSTTKQVQLRSYLSCPAAHNTEFLSQTLKSARLLMHFDMAEVWSSGNIGQRTGFEGFLRPLHPDALL